MDSASPGSLDSRDDGGCPASTSNSTVARVSAALAYHGKQPIGYASTQDWDVHQATITRLYLYEEKTLKEVKKYMELNHGFFATEKMYKVRIKKWGLDKHNNLARVAYMVRQRKIRAVAGKRTTFVIKDHPVDWADVELFLERRPGLLAKMEAGHIEIGGAGGGIVCRTPSPDPAALLRCRPVPQPLAPARDTRLHDEVLMCLRGYLQGSFDKNLWTYSPEAHTYFGPEGQAATMRICAWISDIWSAIHQASQPAEAVATINSYMDHVSLLIKEQDPTLFVHMIRWYYFMYTWDARVCRMIARFIGDMCEVHLGQGHPMTRAWRRIIWLDGVGLQHLLENAARFRLEFVEGLSRRQNERASLILLEEYFLAMSMRWQSNAVEIGRTIDWILDHASAACKTGIAGDYCRMLLRLTAPQIFHGNYAAAMRMLKTVAAWMDRCDEDDRYYMLVSAGYHFNDALLLLEAGREEEARTTIAEGVRVSTQYYCPSRHLIGHVMHWMMSYGIASNPEKARRWQAMMVGAINKVVADWGANRLEKKKGAPRNSGKEPELTSELLSETSVLFPRDELNYMGVWKYFEDPPTPSP